MSEPTSGLVLIDKPAGLTSHQVVGRVRRLAGTRKAGHAGTLDPMATGVLVLGVNRATRLLGHLLLADKRYRATMRLGVGTVSDDADSDEVSWAGAEPAVVERLEAAMARQRGEIEQVPTAVSAIKVAGRRAHALVRAGEEVELTARRVRVEEFRVVGEPRCVRVPGPEGEVPVVDVDVAVHCTSGTYVRALARDVGAELGTGGHLTALRRTAVAAIDVDQCQTLEEAEAGLVVTDLSDAARAHFATAELTAAQAARVRHGGRLDDLELDGLTAVFDPAGEFLALYRPSGGAAVAETVFVAG